MSLNSILEREKDNTFDPDKAILRVYEKIKENMSNDRVLCRLQNNFIGCLVKAIRCLEGRCLVSCSPESFGKFVIEIYNGGYFSLDKFYPLLKIYYGCKHYDDWIEHKQAFCDDWIKVREFLFAKWGWVLSDSKELMGLIKRSSGTFQRDFDESEKRIIKENNDMKYSSGGCKD